MGHLDKNETEMLELADIINQMDLADIYRILHPNTKEYTFFSAPLQNFSKIYYILKHKARLNKYKKIEIPYQNTTD